MTARKIEVISYSGYKGEESPRSISIDGEKIEIIEILKMWIEEDAGRVRKRFFRVKGSDRYIHTLYYDEKLMNWFLR
ncbi:MAG: hypothetical protein FJ241_04545 [Nitrospira sp.]|nr:hypothetical protein [Nitrospira sp.]